MLQGRVIQVVRCYFLDLYYLEVDTLIRISAPATEAHIDAVAGDDHYFPTSSELNMKRQVTGVISESKIFPVLHP